MEVHSNPLILYYGFKYNCIIVNFVSISAALLDKIHSSKPFITLESSRFKVLYGSYRYKQFVNLDLIQLVNNHLMSRTALSHKSLGEYHP